MVNIKKNIRFYQPNDPYYWEVDNLPLTELLSNDIILENRLKALEDALDGLGGSVSGTYSTGILTDLKAYSEPLSGTSSNFGKIFVRSGKFISRIQMPATRESGWRMMRDRDAVFNNESFDTPGSDMLSTTDLSPFVRNTQGMARTAVVEFYKNSDSTNKFISIPSFNAKDFNDSSPPSERLDLVYIKGSKPLDCDGDIPSTSDDYQQDHIPAASIGIIKGAYFRTDAAGGIHTNGTRFTDAVSRLNGRITGMSNADLPLNTNLVGFGSVPMPDDLINQTWHRNYYEKAAEVSDHVLATTQVEREAAFAIPIAYVRVRSNYIEGQPISNEDIIDIRPWLRTAELAYCERAAVAASVGPTGENPFVTQTHLLTKWITPMQTQLDTNTGNIATNAGNIGILQGRMSSVEKSVSGTGTVATPDSLNHEGRIQGLELDSGGGTNTLERHVFLNVPWTVFSSKTRNAINNKTWSISNAVPDNHRANIVAVQFRIRVSGRGNDTNSVNVLQFQGGPMVMHEVARFGIAQSKGDMRRNDVPGPIFYMPVTELTSGSNTVLEFYTTCSGSSDVNWSVYVDGYIYRAFI
jgi:hypothetical protein